MNKVIFKEAEVLIFCRDIQKSDFLRLACDNLLYKANVIFCDSIDSFRTYLVNSKDLVFIDAKLMGEFGDDVRSCLSETNIPHIFVLDPEDSFQNINDYSFSFVNEVDKLSYEQVIGCLAGFLKSVERGDLLAPPNEFQSIKSSFLLRFNKTNSDIYIKIGEDKYLKLLNENEFYDVERIKRYKEKNLEFLYMKKDGIAKFSREMRLLPYLNFERPTGLSELEFSQLKASHILNLCKDMVNSDTLPASMTEIVDIYINEVDEVSRKDTFLLKNLQKMKQRGEYFSEHNFLIAFTISHMMKFLDETYRANKRKLVIATMFHDMLVESPKLVEIQSRKDPRCRLFDQKTLDTYFNHPLQISEMIKKAKIFPTDVAKIILEHHENPQGTGFPHKKGPKAVSTLSALFIVAHSFSELVFQGIFDEVNPDKAFGILESKFEEGFYRTALIALKKAFGAEG